MLSNECKNVIWSREQASVWQEGYPIGNGRLAGMVLGNVRYERVGLNHDRLWRRFWKCPTHNIAEDMPEYKQLCLKKKWDQAFDLMQRKIPAQGKAIYTNPFVPLGDLGIYPHHFGREDVSEYRRELDMDKAIVAVSYNIGDLRLQREYFASMPAGVIVIYMTANRAGRTSGEISLCRMPDRECEVEGKASLGEIVMEGRFEEGVRFASVVRVIQQGGRLTSGISDYLPPESENLELNRPDYIQATHDQPHWFRFRGPSRQTEPRGVSTCFDSSNEVLILVSMATDHEDAKDPVGYCKRRLDSVPIDYHKLREEHIRDHHGFYRRTSISLSGEVNQGKATDELVQQACDNGKGSNLLYEQMFNMGRYLAISSGRPAEQGQPYKAPINLQGIWNQDFRPAWDCDYHIDLNVQMCYWPLPMVNLVELSQPFVDWTTALLPSAFEVAKDVYGVEGAFFAGIDPENMGNSCDLAMLATGCSAWISQILWQVWEYSFDIEQLRNKIYPIIKSIGQFYEEFLIEDDSGRLIPVPSGSPEICPVGRKWDSMLSVPSTFDLELIRQVFTNLVEASEVLDIDADKHIDWTNILKKLPMPTLDSDGRLLEWLDEDYEVTDPSHRHRAHFVGFCPGDRITEEDTPAYNEGIRKALAKRYMYGFKTSCSLDKAWDSQILARLYESGRAMERLNAAVTSNVMGNLLMCICDWREGEDSLRWFGDQRVFQIESSFGMLGAITEMLFQDRQSLLRFLPALPIEWKDGHIKGLLSRGGFEVDVIWKNSQLVEAKIKSMKGRLCRAKSYTSDVALEVFHSGKKIEIIWKDKIAEFPTRTGCSYIVKPSAKS